MAWSAPWLVGQLVWTVWFTILLLRWVVVRRLDLQIVSVFAVVAQEVRELAQRTASAAREVKALITKSAEDVARGVGLVRETGRVLRDIAGKVHAIDTEIKEIARAAHDQSAGIHDINTTIRQLDTVTQQNAAMVEESSAVTHRLSAESTALAQLVGEFEVPLGDITMHGSAGQPRLAAQLRLVVEQVRNGDC